MKTPSAPCSIRAPLCFQSLRAIHALSGHRLGPLAARARGRPGRQAPRCSPGTSPPPASGECPTVLTSLAVFRALTPQTSDALSRAAVARADQDCGRHLSSSTVAYRHGVAGEGRGRQACHEGFSPRRPARSPSRRRERCVQGGQPAGCQEALHCCHLAGGEHARRTGGEAGPHTAGTAPGQ